MGFASISTDVYLPAMPAMAAALHAKQGQLELTVTGFLTGFSIGQLAWGPIGDKFGRRGPIAIGLILFAIGSAGCALSQSVAAVFVWRLVQAVGACAGVVLSRAMVRDIYHGNQAARVLSTALTVMAIAPMIGPLLGGQILLFAGWRAIFWLLVLVGFATLLSLATIEESLPAERRSREPLLGSFSRYCRLIADLRVMRPALAASAYFVGVFAYVAASPFAYVQYYHLPAQYYGFLFGAASLGLMGANMINARLVIRHGPARMLRCGAWIAAISGAACALSTLTDVGGIWVLGVILFLFVSANGFITANALTLAMAELPEQAGSVSALVGTLQYGAGMLGSALVGALANGTPVPLGLVVALAGASCVATQLLWRKPTGNERRP